MAKPPFPRSVRLDLIRSLAPRFAYAFLYKVLKVALAYDKFDDLKGACLMVP